MTAGPRRVGRSVPSWGQALLARGLAAVLWGLVLAAALGGVMALAAGRSPQILESTGHAPLGFAELYLATFLDDPASDTLRLFFGGQLPGLPVSRDHGRPRLSLVRTAALHASHLGAGYWSVRVAGQFRDDDGSLVVRQYLVPVLVHGDRLAATGLPALVAGPASPPAVAAPRPRPPEPSDPRISAVEGFLAALLAGDGDLDRYAAPGTGLRPVVPPPCERVEVVGVASAGSSPEQAVTVVTAACLHDGGLVEFTAYTLRLVRQAGRWEIVEQLPAPPLAGAVAGDRVAPAPHPSGTDRP